MRPDRCQRLELQGPRRKTPIRTLRLEVRRLAHASKSLTRRVSAVDEQMVFVAELAERTHEQVTTVTAVAEGLRRRQISMTASLASQARTNYISNTVTFLFAGLAITGYLVNLIPFFSMILLIGGAGSLMVGIMLLWDLLEQGQSMKRQP